MTKPIAILLSIAGVMVFTVGCGALMVTGSYNNLIILSEEVDAQWGQVENVYQRRADLIPNLVATVAGYAGHENATLVDVTEARAKVGQINVDASQLTPAMLANFQAAQDGLSSALSRLMAVVESYPDLKANDNFARLQDELAGTENRITVERMRFNESAQSYNTSRKRFPTVFIANFFGFEDRPYFEAEDGADEAPEVDFSNLRNQ